MPPTTRFKDSKLDAAWFEKLMADNPVQAVIDPKTGQPNGNFLTGPVRLSWCETLYKPKKDAKGNDVWSTALLFPFGADLSLLVQTVTQCGMANFPENNTPQGFVWHGLKTPFHDQAEKSLKYDGYLPGAYYVNCSSRFQPRIVDTRMNDIVDLPKRCYPGALAILAVNAYDYNNLNKGVSLGIQSVVIIGDDKNIGGGKAANPQQDFAGIQVTADTNISAAFQAGGMPGIPAMPSNADALRALGLA